MSGDDFRRIVGIDLGGTKVYAGIADLHGHVLVDAREQTTPGGGALVEQLEAIVRDLVVRSGAIPIDLVAVGIGVAGVPAGSSITMAPNLGDVEGVDIAGELSRRLRCPVLLENDVNAAALGELAEGIGREHDSFAYIAVGTGIGMGLVLDRTLVRGDRGAAGEIGYLPLGADPLDPLNHARGPLEESLAGDVLAGRYDGGVGAEQVFDRAAEGDTRAASAIDEEARWMAHAMVAVVAVADPGRFVLGGSIGERPELLPPTRAWLKRLGRADIEITISALGARAPVIGAVHLARQLAATIEQGELT